jgi:hypothetical protein
VRNEENAKRNFLAASVFNWIDAKLGSVEGKAKKGFRGSEGAQT